MIKLVIFLIVGCIIGAPLAFFAASLHISTLWGGLAGFVLSGIFTFFGVEVD